jgi:hypothetical protein
MDGNTLLYVLSTLAQTCAALAAFVGAVGVFRLQTLRDQQAAAERDLRELAVLVLARATYGPIEGVLADLAKVENDRTQSNPNLPRAIEARSHWRGFPPQMTKTRRALIGFEIWNLVLIVGSIVGFNYVRALADAPRATAVALWIVAIGTFVVTMWCVVVWTRTDGGIGAGRVGGLWRWALSVVKGES